jgi:class 3 adenylate cyclase
MESHGVPGKIHISRASYSAIRNKDDYRIKERGMINVKGKGPMQTYLINSYDPMVRVRGERGGALGPGPGQGPGP